MPRFNLDILKPLIPQRDPKKPPSLVIVGMGNPGPKYAKTRHNAGFWFIDKLADKYGVKMARGHRSTHLAECEIEGHKVVLSKPRTYVNLTGIAVTYLLARYHIKFENLLIACDEIALTPGVVRLRPGRSGGPQRHEVGNRSARLSKLREAPHRSRSPLPRRRPNRLRPGRPIHRGSGEDRRRGG